VISNRLEQQILGLFKDITASYSILQISKKLKTSYPHIYNKVQELIQSGILKKISVGPSHICQINLKNDLAIQLLILNEIQLREQWQKSFKRSGIVEAIKGLKREYRISTVVYANNKFLFVTDELTEKPITKKIAAVPNSELLSGSQFLNLLATEMIFLHAVVVVGFENYFEYLREVWEKLPNRIVK
jgi:DNA-binding Lrp family transcriptional regulator